MRSHCKTWQNQEIAERFVHNFLSYFANTQRNKQTNKVWQKHNLLGGGKYYPECCCTTHFLVAYLLAYMYITGLKDH